MPDYLLSYLLLHFIIFRTMHQSGAHLPKCPLYDYNRSSGTLSFFREEDTFVCVLQVAANKQLKRKTETKTEKP